MNLKFPYTGICSSTPSQDNTNKQNMNDNQSSSRSKKRRQRRRNRKISNSQNNSDNDINNVPQEEYTVQSPVEIVETKSKNKPTKPVKSRSLDDDEMVQIHEVNSEMSESDDKEKETQAIISEASESEVEWEEASDLNTPSPSLGSLSTITLPLEGYSSEQITLMSPEEEKTLRDFLEGLNLVSGPEEAASQVNDKNSPESIKQRKARKKVELEQYFLPIYQNPRYLDVISEENSDRDSDREQTKINLTRQLRKGTPEDNNPPKKTRKLPPTKFSAPIDQSPAVLVDAKIIETPVVSETIHSQSFITTGEEAKASTVEVVYLTSSGTDSADESDSKSSDSYVIGSSNEDLSEKTVVNDKTDEITNTQTIVNTHKKDTDIPPSIYGDYKVKDAEHLDLLSELTPPLTPDNMSPKEDINIKDTSTKCHTPPPSRSSSSSESSSRDSSLCTAKYIPSISSLTDVISLAKEEESYLQPITLREICLRFLISMPFGKEILEEIADVSKYIESYTRSLPSTVLPRLVPNLATFGNKNNSHSNHLSNLSVKLSPKILEEKKTVSTEKDYVIPEIINDRMSENVSSERQLNNPIQFTEKFNKETKLNEEKLESTTESLTERHETKTCFTVRKLNNSQSEKITIPPNTERNLPPVPSANADLKEVIIPIQIEETVVPKEFVIPVKQEISHSSKNLITNAVTQPLTGLREKSKEVIIPIKKEDITPPKEIIVPVQKEVPKPPERSKVSKDSVSKSKEVIIPVRKEVREISQSDITKTVSTQNTTLFQAHETKLNGREVKPKEVIIPKEVTAATKSPKKVIDSPGFKEVIIPITLEVKGSNKPVPQEKPKAKEFIVPITKEIPASLLTPPDDPKDVIMPITNKETEIQKIEHTKWIGMASGQDLNVLVCLSPKQKDQLEKSKAIPDEASKLIELHEKFVNRSIAHEESRKEYDARVQVTCNNPESPRLLTIIKEEPSTSNDYIYFVEKEPRSSTLPRGLTNARLNAKDLSEWLNLARNKSMSESNLTTVPDYPENNLRNNLNMQPTAPRRRTSLPHDIFEKQMIYIQEKEREIQRQLEALEEEKRLLNAEMAPSRQFHAEDYYFSRKGDFAESKKRPTSMPMMPTEYFRQQMYEEYMDKFQEREDRKQHKIIKVTSTKDINQESGKEIVHPIQLEDEFMTKVKELQKVGKLEKIKSQDKEVPSVENNNEDPPVLVMDREKLKEAKELPKHLQEFVGDDGIWSPGQKIELSPKEEESKRFNFNQDESISPIWTPKSANSSPIAERKEFKSVNFQSPVLGRRNRTTSETLGSTSQVQAPPWKGSDYKNEKESTSLISERRLPTSRSTPISGFSELSSTSRLPKAQNPTITLLQKAREGQLPKGASYIEETRQYKLKNERPPIATPGEVLYHIKNEYTSESDNEKPRKMTDLGPRKFEGVGPVSRDGIPLVLRSEVKDQNQSKWYKRMYDTIHKQKPQNDEYVTIRYKQKRAQYPYTSGYLSEPEPGAYDSDFTDYKYQTLDRKRTQPEDRSTEYISSTMPRPTVNRSFSSDIVKNTEHYYNTQPGRIENYTPGHSSISEKEAKQWWDEVMDIFDGHLEQQKKIQANLNPKSFINQALKESGYESDSTLVFRRREEAAQQLSPKEQREAYKVIQKGGDIPLHGLRKPAPEKPKESPRKYVENDVTIHYKTPIRQEVKGYLSEDELAHRQAEAMKKIYQEERRKKYLQELQDMNSRRHTDNFIPSQKSPISLNRYDDFEDLAPNVRPRPRSPEHRLCARALYNFVGQSARELTFRKGDIIYLRRQIDKNWYEGELNAMVGLFPANYIEIIPFEGSKTKTTLRKAHEGQARAKYNFVAQTHLELSLAKGELVVVTRKIDDNWFEGKIGGRKGIFPANYVEMLIDPQTSPAATSKPVASPASHSLLLNGSSSGKESMGSHSYTPTLSSSYHAKPVHILNSGGYNSLNNKNPALSQALHIETQSEPIPYRAMYKYKPQNEDELELLEGDTVYVLEKCDDGWFVGSSERTGAFGTFPGNYVEKI